MKFQMYPLDRYSDGKATKIPALEQDGFGYGILTVTAGTTGYCGGDSGHGGESFIKLNMEGGDLSASIDGRTTERGITDLVISVGGDWELDALIEGFRYAAETLTAIKDMRRHFA